MIPTKYNVDFSSYERDFAARAQARLLQQFQGKPVLAQVVAALSSVKQQHYDAALAVLKSRALAYAGGAQLAALGRIVGQTPQFIPESQPAPFFTWDTPTLGWENGWWGVGQSLLTTARPPTDPEFALQVLARMHLNMNRFSSIPELQAAILDVFGINVSFSGAPPPADTDFTWDTADLGWDEGEWFAFSPPTLESFYIVVPANTPAATVFLLQEFVANQRVDALPFIAWPVTFALKSVIYH